MPGRRLGRGYEYHNNPAVLGLTRAFAPGGRAPTDIMSV